MLRLVGPYITVFALNVIILSRVGFGHAHCMAGYRIGILLLPYAPVADVLDINQATALAGVAIKTVSAWARKNRFESFKRNNAYHIPKVSLVEYLGK